MRKTEIRVESVDSFFERGRKLAKAADRGARIPSSRVVAFEDVKDLLGLLTAKRVLLLKQVKETSSSIGTLARKLNRDRSAVARDVQMLERFGVLHVTEKPYPGTENRSGSLPWPAKSNSLRCFKFAPFYVPRSTSHDPIALSAPAQSRPGTGPEQADRTKHSVQHESIQLIATGCQNVLAPVQHVSLGSICRGADMGVPDRLAIGRIPRHQIVAVSAEQ